MLVSVALGILVAGVIVLEGGNAISTAKLLMKIGAGALLLCWALLFTWIVVSMTSDEKTRAMIPLGGGPLGMLIQSFSSSRRTHHRCRRSCVRRWHERQSLTYVLLTPNILKCLRSCNTVLLWQSSSSRLVAPIPSVSSSSKAFNLFNVVGDRSHPERGA
jgi:hypothetical protein